MQRLLALFHLIQPLLFRAYYLNTHFLAHLSFTSMAQKLTPLQLSNTQIHGSMINKLSPVEVARSVRRGDLHQQNAKQLVNPAWLKEFQRSFDKFMKDQSQAKPTKDTIFLENQAEKLAVGKITTKSLDKAAVNFRQKLDDVNLANLRLDDKNVLRLKPIEVAAQTFLGNIPENGAKKLVNPLWLKEALKFVELDFNRVERLRAQYPGTGSFQAGSPPKFKHDPLDSQTLQQRSYLSRLEVSFQQQGLKTRDASSLEKPLQKKPIEKSSDNSVNFKQLYQNAKNRIVNIYKSPPTTKQTHRL